MSHNPRMGVWGMLFVCRHSLLPHAPMLFYKAMSKNYINHIGTYNDNSKSLTINTSNANVSEIVRSFLAEDVEEVKLKELNLYTLEEFEEKYRKAVKGGAPKLAEFLKRYKELEVFDFEDRNKKEIFEGLKTFFGDEMDFGYPNFAAYY